MLALARGFRARDPLTTRVPDRSAVYVADSFCAAHGLQSWLPSAAGGPGTGRRCGEQLLPGSALFNCVLWMLET